MKNFRQLMDEFDERKRAVFTFGRMNPPTKAHEKLCESVVQEAKTLGATPFIFLSRTVDKKKNPLTLDEKLKYLNLGLKEEVFSAIYDSTNMRTPFDAFRFLNEEGYNDVTMIVGSDRIAEFEYKLNQYNGKEYNFKNIDVISCGSRDLDGEHGSIVSASLLRECVQSNNTTQFNENTLSGLSSFYRSELFELLRYRMMGEEAMLPVMDSLGVSREQMPQFHTSQQVSEFLSFLSSRGISYKVDNVDISCLKPTQKELNSDILDKKVREYIDLGGNFDSPQRIIVSQDDDIVDGHHRWAAIKTLEPQSAIEVLRIDLNVGDLLKILSSFQPKEDVSLNSFEKGVIKRVK